MSAADWTAPGERFYVATVKAQRGTLLGGVTEHHSTPMCRHHAEGWATTVRNGNLDAGRNPDGQTQLTELSPKVAGSRSCPGCEFERLSEAERIAARYGNDGHRWHDDDEIEMDEACREAGASEVFSCYHEATRFEFADGSAIITTGAGWDVGFSAPCECHCWPEALRGEHVDGCRYREGGTP